MENKNNIFRGEFLPWIVKWGRATNLLGVVLAFGPCLALAMMGIWPNWTALAAAAAVQIPGLIWFIKSKAGKKHVPDAKFVPIDEDIIDL